MSKSRVLGREDIFAVDDRKRELVEVPEWGGAVYIRALSGGERAEYTASIMEIGSDGKPRAKIENADLTLAYLSLCDVDGRRLFTSRKDFEGLALKSAVALKRVVKAAERLSSLGAEAASDAVGNSSMESSGDSSTS